MAAGPPGHDRAEVVLVKGAGDVGSAVAHRLYQAGLRPVIVDAATPSVARRQMAFSDSRRLTLSGRSAGIADRLGPSARPPLPDLDRVHAGMIQGLGGPASCIVPRR